MKNTDTKTIFVGVSGGVDSSVALALLKKQGHDVVGVFMRTWQPDWIECTWKDERRDAMRVCAHLDVPFVELDLEDAYKKGVADYMIEEYRLGRTPNPDVMCNREVKFGAFWQWAKANGADAIATGHYAQNINGVMHRGKDSNKDQSYFLWTLDQDDLNHVVFPVGSYKKKQVRKLARAFDLPTAQKKDSQGVCFLGEIDMKDFLGHYITEEEGNVLDLDGNIIGTHRGVLFYTLEERHGFSIHASVKGTSDKPYYVVAKDIPANTITVSTEREKAPSYGKIVNLDSVVDQNRGLVVGQRIQAQIRYRGEILQASVKSLDRNASRAVLEFEKPVLVSSGQSIVFYNDTICLGGGIAV